MWIKTKAPRARLPLAIALLLAWWLACWLATGAWFDDETQEAYRAESLKAERFVTTSTHDFERIVSLRTGLPKSLTRIPMVGQTLSRFGAEQPSSPTDEEERRRRWSVDPELAQTNRFLDASARDLGLDTLVLLNANGDCLAASNAGSERSSVGASYGDRNDFQSARAGRSGYQVIVDKKMPSVGLTLYAPVIDHGHFIGAVIVGIPLAPFANLFEQTDAFLSDRNGVVVLARDPSLLLHALPGAPVGRLDVPARQALYQRTELPTLALTPWGNARYPELLRVEGRIAPVILSSRSVADGGLTVSVLWPMPQLATLAQQRLLYAGALGTIGTLLMLLATAYVTRRREQRTMALALAQREQQATQARNFLDQVVKAIADPIFVKDREHRWVLVNQAFCKIHGQPRENFIGKSAHDAFPERIAQGIWDADERVLTAGIEIIAEEKLTDSQGVTHIVVTKKAPYTDAAGQCFIVGTISDISERKQVERLLRTRQREFRNLAENNPDVIIRYDRECRRIYANSSLVTMAGREAEELVGRLPVDHTPLTDPVRYMAELRRVMESGAPSSFDVLVRRANGEAGWYEIRMVAEFDEAGQLVGVLTVARDVTERKAMEETLALREQEYRSLAENLPDNVTRWDVDGRYLYINSVHERTLGVSKNDMIGKAIPDSHTFVKAAIAQIVATGQATMLVRQSVVVDGETQIHDVSLAPEHDAEGHVVSVLGVGRDMTDIYRMQEAIAARDAEFRTLVEQAPEPIFRYAPDGRRIYVNAAVERISGMPASVLLGGPSSDGAIASAQDNAAVVALVQRIFETGEPGEIEVENVGADGRLRHFHNRLAPEFGADGKVRSVFCICHDITERTRMEEALREREQRYRGIFDNVLDTLYLLEVTPEGRFRNLEVNPAFEKLSGLSSAELIGKFIEETMPQEVAEIVIAQYRRCIEVGTAIDEEVSLDMPSGFRHYHSSLIPVRDDRGRIHRIVGISRDITERKRMEEALVTREREFRTLAEHSPDPIYRYDRDCRRLYVNPVVGRIIGKPVEELIGTTPADGAILVSEQNRKVMQAVHHVFDSGETDHIDLNFIDRDGQNRDYQMLLVPEHDAGGQVVTVLAMARDVTTIRDAERRMSRFFANVPGFVYSLRMSPDGHFSFPFASPGIEDIYGVRPEDVVDDATTNTAHVLHPDDVDRVTAGLLESARTLAPYQIEFRIALPGKGERWIESRALPEREAEGGTLWHGLMLDITERKRMELHLERAQHLLRQLAARNETAREDERKYLKREIHDELGQYLLALRLGISVVGIQFGVTNAPLQEKTQRLIQIVDSTIKVVRNMLASLRPAALDMGIVPALEWLAGEYSERTGIQCELHISEESIDLDDTFATAIFRIVQESLTNVVRHAQASKVEITLERNEANYLLEVRDNGRGFDPTVRKEKSFGLVSIRERALMLGGEVEISSEPGRSTAIRVHIPINNLVTNALGKS